jgi:hypothetical protein
MDTAKQIIDDLISRFQLTDSEISQLCNSSQPTIWRIRNEAVKECSSGLYIALTQLRKSMNRKRPSKEKSAA